MYKKNKIKVAINARMLINTKQEGIGVFTENILRELTLLRSDIDFYFIFDRKYNDRFIFSNNIYPKILYPSARHPILWYLWFEFIVKQYLNKLKPDIFLSLDSYSSISYKGKKITVVHDIAFEFFENHLPKIVLSYLKKFIPKYIKNSTLTIAVSESTKKDIIDKYNIDESLVEVVYNSVNETFCNISDKECEVFRKKNVYDNNYFLFVSAIHPRKNLSLLLEAFTKYKKETKSKDKLVIIGRFAWNCQEEKRLIKEHIFIEDIIHLNHIENQKLNMWYSASKALIYPSFYEGFGIPIIEAQKSGTAVICSNNSSMKEIGNDSVILINPYKVDELVEAMKKINDIDYRESLILKGYKNVEKYSWKNSAKKMSDLIDKVLN